jgi:hypothetical protein
MVMRRFIQVGPVAATLAMTAAAALMFSMAGLSAQAGQAQPGNQTPATPPTPPRPLVPVTASSIMKAPDRYLGETVTMTGVVDRAMSMTTFTVDQDPETKSEDAVLVIARRTLNEKVAEDEYVTVVGELIRYDPAEVATRKDPVFDTQLPADATTAFVGRPVVLATVVFQGSRDIAMRLPPPMTPAEEAFQKVMRAIGPANGAFRKGMAGSNAELAREHLATLRTSFAEAEKFFRSQRVNEAVRWAQDARRVTESIDKAVVGGNWATVKAGADNLAKACATCHDKYRERYDDGSFRVRFPDE